MAATLMKACLIAAMGRSHKQSLLLQDIRTSNHRLGRVMMLIDLIDR